MLALQMLVWDVTLNAHVYRRPEEAFFVCTVDT